MGENIKFKQSNTIQWHDLSKDSKDLPKEDCGSCKHINKRYQINDICDSCFVYDKWELVE